MKSDYPFPDKCEKCIHNDVCYMVGECLNHIPDFECDCFEEKRPHGEWIRYTEDGFDYAKCSACKWDSGEAFEYAIDRFPFCPNCGSDNRPKGVETE